MAGKGVLIHYLLVLLLSSFTHVKGFDLGDIFFPPIHDLPFDFYLGQTPWDNKPSPSPPPSRQQSPPPPSTDPSIFIPPVLIPPIDKSPLIAPLIPIVSSIINPTTPPSQSSPSVDKSPPSPSQCKPSQPIKLTPPPPAKQPPARQPTPPPVKPPSPSRPPPPPSKKSPPPAPPPSIANPPVMAPAPSPSPHPPVIIAPVPSSPVAKPPVIPRGPSLPPVTTLTVNGVVYCKPCNSYGVPNLLNAIPIQGTNYLINTLFSP